MRIKVKNPVRFAALAAILVLLVAYLLWIFPINISHYVNTNKTSGIGILYSKCSADNTSSSNQYFATQNATEINKVINSVNHYRYYKKLIQPNRVKSYSGDSIFIKIIFYNGAIGNEKRALTLDIASTDGYAEDVTIETDGKKIVAYEVGFWGNGDEQSLFDNLNSLVQFASTSDQWKTS